MIVDTHVHYGIWSGTPHYSVEEMLAEASLAGVDRIVQVTNTRAGWDNTVSLDGAARHPDRVAGVIGRFDPVSPNVESRLEACSAQPGMLGVRINISPESIWLRERVLDPFFFAARKFDVSVLLISGQLPEMRETAKRFPQLRFLIDHMGLTGETMQGNKDPYGHWPALLELAEAPNVWTKVSYFPEASAKIEKYPFPIAQGRFRQLYEQLGPTKLVWGSNFPPVKHVCTYRESLDFVRVHCDFLSAGDKAAILGENFMTHFGPGKSKESGR
jgi:predicted TIM-barrel fold metal-dependent hydrolase